LFDCTFKNLSQLKRSRDHIQIRDPEIIQDPIRSISKNDLLSSVLFLLYRPQKNINMHVLMYDWIKRLLSQLMEPEKLKILDPIYKMM